MIFGLSEATHAITP